MNNHSTAKRTSEHTQVDAELSDNACIAANRMNGTKVSMVSCSADLGVVPEGYTAQLCQQPFMHKSKLLDPSGKFVMWLSERPLTPRQLLRLARKFISEGCRAGLVDPALAREALESFRFLEASALPSLLHCLAENCALKSAAVTEVAACK